MIDVLLQIFSFLGLSLGLVIVLALWALILFVVIDTVITGIKEYRNGNNE